MSKEFHLLFKVVSVIRLLGIPMIFILDKLWSDSIPDAGIWKEFEIDLHFSFWQYLIMYSIMIVFPINTIISLLISFTSVKVSGLLQKKSLWLFFYIAELIILPFLFYGSYVQVKETFFPPKTTLIGEVINFFIPPDKSTNIYEKLQVINLCILTGCSIFFVICFRKFYKATRLQFAEPTLP